MREREPGLESTLAELGESVDITPMADGWDESMRSLPETVRFLARGEIHHAREYCGLPADLEEPLVECAGRIAENPALVRLAWHTARRLFDSPDRADFRAWPQLRAALGNGEPIRDGRFTAGGGAFYLIVALSMVRRVASVHVELEIPADVTRATCRQIACFANNYRLGNDGRLGLFRRQLSWLRNYTDGRLFRLGRFEYMLKELDDRLTLFRDRTNGRYLALAAAGGLYDADGFAVSEEPAAAGSAGDAALGAFRTRCSIDDRRAVGHPVDPAGRVLPNPVTLDLGRWLVVLKPEGTVIDLHIPADGRMPLDACGDSMRRAVGFFARHFPERPAVAFWCRSWIFGPQLEQFLPPDSNLVRFLRQACLLPVPSGAGSLWFIYLRDDIDPANAPRENGFQAAVADFLASGGVWREAAMVYPLDAMERFGAEPFRSDWTAAVG